MNRGGDGPIYVSIRTGNGGHDEECPKYNVAMSGSGAIPAGPDGSDAGEGDRLISADDD